MTKKDYLKDSFSYILVYYLALSLGFLVNFLDLVNRELRVSLSSFIYSYFLASVLLILFLVIDYKRKNKFLEIISQGESSDDIRYIFNLPQGISREYDLIRLGYTNNYSKYIARLEEYIDRQDLQKKFNNRWIHEMKTPLSVMKLVVEEEKEIGGISGSGLRSLEEELERLSNGLEMGLYALRVDDFESDLKAEEVEVLGLLRQVINENRRSFILNSVYPKILFEEEYLVKSDRKWLKFVFNQLLSNSIKYTKVKENQLREIRIDMTDKDGLILSIEDNGIGIASSDINRIFDPFFTGRNGRRYLESTGMGLFLVKEILDKLGHAIRVESIEGESSKFSIIFFEDRNIYKF